MALYFSSLVTLLYRETLLTRVQHFQQLTQSKVSVPSEYWDIDRKEDHGRAYLNHLDKNWQLFFNALISSHRICWRVLRGA